MVTLKELGLSFYDYNTKMLAAWHVPYYFTALYRQATASARSAYFGNPLGLDGAVDPTLVLSNLTATEYDDLTADDKAKIDEIAFNKLALRAYEIVRNKGNPTIGDNIDFLYAATDSKTGGLLLSDNGKGYVVAKIRSAIYSQIEAWMLNNPFERTNSSSYSSNSGQASNFDASTWLSSWDALCTETKTQMVKSRLYSSLDMRDDYSDFWVVDPALAIEKRPTTGGTIDSVIAANPIVLKDYVDSQITSINSAISNLDNIDDTRITALENALGLTSGSTSPPTDDSEMDSATITALDSTTIN